MGIYLNPIAKAFKDSLDSEIYVDKTGLIDELNRVINTQQKYICVSRPRRFGKSMALNMLSAYYSRGQNTDALFKGLLIGHAGSYRKHLGQYDVIRLNMQNFATLSDTPLKTLQRYLITELLQEYPDVRHLDKENLANIMEEIYAVTERPFIILIDEWDCFFRGAVQDRTRQMDYLDFLRSWLKDRDCVGLVYMTGILPIKKYGTHSALNMFSEYSMTSPGPLAEFFGFTENEVEKLCMDYELDFEETKGWYDGYTLTGKGLKKKEDYSMYSPKSVVEAILRRQFDTYWNNTETYEALRDYITLNVDGLKEQVVRMIGGESISVDTGTFSNDMTTFSSGDDVLTLLIHLGYLSYSINDSTVRIPNKEVSLEYIRAVKTARWGEIALAINASRTLLNAIWDRDSRAVADGIALAHNEISILAYNDENSLCCTVMLALFFAREFYTSVRECPTGKGFADIVFIPRPKYKDKPVIIIELKRDRSAESAIAQIKERGYPAKFTDYEAILVGINYDSRTKEHSCLIEKCSSGDHKRN